MIFFSFLFSIGVNMLMFLPTYFKKTDKLTDVSYAATFIFVSVITFLSNSFSFSKFFLLMMILIWAMRLGIFLLIRIRKSGKDKRFDGMRENFWKFARFWFLQGLTVFIVLVPALFYFLKENVFLDYFSIVGICIWLSGFLIESIADYQKYAFSLSPKNKDRFIQNGIWKYSRHPNYLGEMLIWIGIYVFCFPALTFLESMLGLISPLYIILLLLFVSGVPLLEKYADEKWGNEKEYREYKKNTGVLIPKQAMSLLLAILIAQSAGILGSIFTYESINTWYNYIQKPFFTPPSLVFGPVWTLLFTLMGISSWIIWNERKKSPLSIKALIWYFIQLILNTLWSILFFGFKNPGLAFFEILLLWILIFVVILQFLKIKKAAGVLLIPYLCWVTFAAMLNFSIWQLN